MTQLDILKMAKAQALADWDKAYDRFKRNSDSAALAASYESAKQRYNDVCAMLEEEEAKALPLGRLTRWNGKKWVLPQGRTSDGESYFRIIAERLAAYENTGCTPDEIASMLAERR